MILSHTTGPTMVSRTNEAAFDSFEPTAVRSLRRQLIKQYLGCENQKKQHLRNELRITHYSANSDANRRLGWRRFFDGARESFVGPLHHFVGEQSTGKDLFR